MVARMRAQVAPTGCPSEIPDPFGLSRSSSGPMPHSASTASACAANASLSSIRSRSARLSPARSSASADLVAASGHLDGYELGREAPFRLRPGRLAMGRQGQRVLRLAADAVLAAQILGGLDHAARDGMLPAAGSLACPRQPVAQRDTVTADTLPQQRVVLDAAHGLGPAGDDQFRDARADLHGGVQHCLQAGAAPAGDLGSGNADAQPGIERDDASQRREFAGRVAVAQDDVVDVTVAEAGAAGDLADDDGREVGRRQPGQAAQVAPDRGTERFTDDDVVHEFILSGTYVVSKTDLLGLISRSSE